MQRDNARVAALPVYSRTSIEGERSLLEARWSWCCANAGLEKAPRSGRKGINGLPLPAAIVMIDAIALIVPEEETGTNKVRDRAADIGLARCPYAQADLGVQRPRSLVWIGREDALPCHFIADTFDEGQSAWVPMAHRRQGIA